MAQETTTGVVIDHRTRRSGGGGYLIFPVVRYQMRDGNEIEFEAPLGSNVPPAVGEQVTVFYEPERPQEARLSLGSTVRFNPRLLLVAGAIFLGAMLLFFLFFVAVIVFVSL
jgi:hypothetical protein